jgi:iron(III) transport system ATP-binding protein
MSLRINQLSFAYFKDKPILKQLSLSSDPGKITAIIGPSGIGKTTLFSLILGVYKPHSGSIYVDDKLLSSTENMVAIEKRNIGVVFQDYALFPHLNVDDNIWFGVKNKRDVMLQKKINQLIEIFKIRPFIKQFPFELSGGQMQRVAFVRALAAQPKVLLLDEPFSNLDEALTYELRVKLVKWIQQEQIITLLITHDELDLKIANQIITMKNHL